ncbi:MAG: hypothetical protein V4480_03860 [Patescibacteria group bacterium]
MSRQTISWTALGIIIIGTGISWFAISHKAADSDQAAISTPPASASSTDSRLATHLSKITPQFIAADTTLSPELENIRQDIKSILLDSQSDPQIDIALDAVGSRYVVATVLYPTDRGSSPQVIDSATLDSSTYIPGLYEFTVGKTQIYVSATDICTYTLDQPSCVPLPKAKLSGGELYGDDSGMAGYFVPQDLTHTNTSMTIAVLAWENPYTSRAKLKKVRDVTLVLP